MRSAARSAMATRFIRSIGLGVPGAMMLLLSGCAGVGNYLDSTLSPFGNPNAPKGYALNMQRARGEDVAVAPIRPEPGDVWPGPVRPVPTLGDIQRHMNTPLGQEYQSQYGGSGAPNATYSVPNSGPESGPQSGAEAGQAGAGQRKPGRTKSGSYGHTMNSSSTPPGNVQSGVPSEPAIPATPPTPAQQISPNKGFAVGQTLMGPTGPAGVVTGSSNGRYQTVAPINGVGGGIVIPNGNGTATLIQPNGQVVSVQSR